MKIELVGVSYGIGTYKILEDIDLSLKGPALVQLIGPNGAGKTTLLRIIAGLIKPAKGIVRVCGVDATGNPHIAGKCIGYVPQRPPLSKYNPMTVYDFLSSRGMFTRKWPRISLRKRLDEKLLRVLKETGLPSQVLEKRLWELSGGELMRVFIARTLLYNPDILLLDEPLAPVDPRGKIELSHLLAGMSKSKLVVVTSHDPILLEKDSDLIILLNKKIHAIGPPSRVLTREVLSAVYGHALVEVERHVHILDEHGGGRK